ncbi:MAG: methylaspartate mutase subunit S [Cetobacterium sp.]|uniref:methylaspartate mutase subunit S n=1 Tax=Cetobacterium sp. TaxID=2071632 RepID=UPI003F315AF1
MKNGKKVVIGVIGSDCHAVGNKIIHHVLETNGFEVINIGVLSPQIDFINAAIETEADAIIVSSLYGHGELDCQGMREKCKEVGLENILLYVGGNIVVGKQEWSNVEERFKLMGFDRVYKPGTPIELTTEHLKGDLGLAKSI